MYAPCGSPGGVPSSFPTLRVSPFSSIDSANPYLVLLQMIGLQLLVDSQHGPELLKTTSSAGRKHFTSSDPRHDMSIICFHAMVRSMLPSFVVFDFAFGSSGLGLLF